MERLDLPAPSEYSDWQSWAASLVSALTRQGSETINFPLFIYDESKPRNGLPVAADGDTIRVQDKNGTISLKCWRAKTKQWENL